MSEYKGVPGPFEYEYRDWRGQPSIHAHIRGVISVDEDEDGDTAVTAVTVCVVPGNATSEPVTRDTARLLAASWDLLKACELAATGTPETGLERYVMATLKAAIAKATDPLHGEQGSGEGSK